MVSFEKSYVENCQLRPMTSYFQNTILLFTIHYNCMWTGHNDIIYQPFKYSMVLGFFSLYVIEELNISAEWFGNSILDQVHFPV